MHAEHYFGDIALLDCIEHTGNGIEVVAVEGVDLSVGSGSCSPCSIKRIARQCLGRWTVIVAHMQGIEVVCSADCASTQPFLPMQGWL